MEATNTPAINYSYLPSLMGHLAGLAHLRATQLCTEELATLALTPKQFVTLEFIAHNTTVSQREIADHVGTTPTVLVGVLDALTERGFVQRVRSSTDRRRHSVALTEQGEAIRPKIKAAAHAVEQRLQAESGLDSAEWQTLIHLMQKLTHRSELPL